VATLTTDHEDNVVRIGVLETDVATLTTDHQDNVARIGVLETDVATLTTDHQDNVARIGVLETDVATLTTDHGDNVARIGVLETNVVDLWDNLYSNVARLDTAIDDITDLENTRATYLDPTFTSNIVVNNVAHVSNGLAVNNTRFYAHTGSLSSTSVLGLEFTSNVFYARVVAQLLNGDEDVNTLVLELQGGHRNATPTKNIKVGTLNKFGDTSYPWSTSVTTTTTEVTIQPEDPNQDYDYDIAVEYISSGTDAKLVAIKEGVTIVKNFAY